MTLYERAARWLPKTAGKEFTARDVQRAIGKGLTSEAILDVMDVCERQALVTRRYTREGKSARYVIVRAVENEDTAAEYAARLEELIPDSTEPNISAQIPMLFGDRACISDTHFPYHSGPLLRQFASDAAARGIKRFVLIGDMMDGNQFHPKRGGCQQHSRRWQEDAEVAKTVLRGLLEVFEGGEVLTGNHDAWFQAHFRGQVDPEWLMENIFSEFGDKLKFSRFEQAVLKSGGKEFRLMHGANYSGPNPIGVAKRLSAKFESGIIMGHQHHQECGWSVSGKHRVVCMGGAHDPALFGYTQISPRTNPVQTQGYCMIQNGQVEVFDRQYSRVR